MPRTITHLYDSYDRAARTVQELESAGIFHDDIGILGKAGDHADNDAGEGAAAGASAGTILGGGAGLLAGLGLLGIPGIGPVVAAGWLVATVAGAAAGAAAGGLLGTLIGAGISEEHAHIYAEGVRRGGTLVSVRVTDHRAEIVEGIMLRNGPIDPVEQARVFYEGGWKAFDEKASYSPPTAEQVSGHNSKRAS